MAQGSLALPTVGTVSGLEVLTDANAALAALVSANSGASAPANAAGGTPVEGQLWLDTSATPHALKIYSGTAWVQIGTLDVGTGLWSESIVNAARAFSAAQIAQALDNLSASYRMTLGQCDLAKSGSDVLLLPRNGNLLTVNGKQCTIPDAGVALAPTGLTPGTLYFIYAVATAGVITSLEASTTGHATSTTAGNKGTEIKSGDDTRTLVGMVRPVTGPAFADSATQRFVRSWFNRKRVTLRGVLGGGSLGGSFVEINSSIRTEFLIWSGEVAHYDADVRWYNNSSISTITLAHAFDTSSDANATVFIGDGAGADRQVAFSHASQSLAEGYHYHTLYGSHSVGSTTIAAGTKSTGVIG